MVIGMSYRGVAEEEVKEGELETLKRPGQGPRKSRAHGSLIKRLDGPLLSGFS